MICLVDRVVKVTLRAQVAEYNQGMLQAAQATRTVGTEAEKLAQQREAFQTLGRGLTIAGAAMVATTALTVRAAAQWESAWAGVTKTVDGTPEQLARVEEGLRGLSKVLPASHDEIAAVAEAAGQLGIRTENVVAFTRTMIDLGETTNLSANDAATALARFTNIMGTSQDDVDRLGSAIVGLGNNYATTESEILEMSMRLAGAGRQIGLTEGDVLGLATALSSVGIEAEAGGSAMSKVMIDIAASVEDGGDRLELFARTAGMSAQDFADKWRKAPSEALAAFVTGLSNAESQGTSTLGVLSELEITEVRMRDALLRSSAAAGEFSQAMADGNEEFEKNNALTLEAEKRYATVESKIAIAGNAINDMAISFGEVLLPVVGTAADAVSGFAGFLGDLPGPVQGVITVLGGAAGVVALVGGAALLAVPQIGAFKTALDTMNWSMKGLATAGGIVGVTLTALVTIIGAVSAAHAQAKQRAEQYAGALSQGEEAARQFIAEQLAMEDSFLWMSRGSAVDNAKKLGISIEDVTDAVTGSADEFERFKENVQAAYEERGSGVEFGIAAQQLREKVEQLRNAQEDSAEAAKDTAEANDALANSLGVAEDATSDFEQQVTDAETALDDMNRALEDVGGTALGMGDAIDRAQSAINALTKAAKEDGVAIDGTNDASIRFRSSLRDVETSSRDAAQAMLDNGESVEDAKKKYQDGRQAIIDMLIARGLDADEARAWADTNMGAAADAERAIEDYADALNNVPKRVTTGLDLTGVSEAEARLRGFINSWNGRRISIGVDTYGGTTYQFTPGGPVANADGNIHSYASGGFGAGIYSGGPPLYKFAEPETGWEAFISGKPSERDRNVGIWQEAGRRLGAGGPVAGESKVINLTQHITVPAGIDTEAVAEAVGRRQAFELRGA